MAEVLMNCPHCNQPVPDQLMRQALNAAIAKRKRPGAVGLVRNPGGRTAKHRGEELERMWRYAADASWYVKAGRPESAAYWAKASASIAFTLEPSLRA